MGLMAPWVDQTEGFLLAPAGDLVPLEGYCPFLHLQGNLQLLLLLMGWPLNLLLLLHRWPQRPAPG